MLPAVPLSSNAFNTAVIGVRKTPANMTAVPARTIVLCGPVAIGSHSGVNPRTAPPRITPRKNVGANTPPGFPVPNASPGTSLLTIASVAIVYHAY